MLLTNDPNLVPFTYIWCLEYSIGLSLRPWVIQMLMGSIILFLFGW